MVLVPSASLSAAFSRRVSKHGHGDQSFRANRGHGIFSQTHYHPPNPGKNMPFISTSSALVDLNALIPAGSGFVLTDAIAINAFAFGCAPRNPVGYAFSCVKM